MQIKPENRSQTVHFSAVRSAEENLSHFGSRLTGLSGGEVLTSRADNGNNKITHGKKKSLCKRLTEAFINPFTAILLALASVSAVTDIIFPLYSLFGANPEDCDPVTVIIIAAMVFVSGSLRFVQESKSGSAAQKLLDLITTTCTVTRENSIKTEIPLEEAVVGDIVHLSAGDMIPADLRILDAKDLFVSQASLTGESEPVEKIPAANSPKENVTDYSDIAFMGSSVISGTATALVIAAGDNTMFGQMARQIDTEPAETSFAKGVNAVSWVAYPLHAGYGSRGLFRQRHHKGKLG